MSDNTGPHDSEPDREREEDSFDALLQRAARLTPWPVSHQLHPGLELCEGRFQLIRRLGSGGMGMVYEAYDRARDSEVALKTLSQLHPTGIYRMKSEFRGLADVVHPNLVRLHDLFVDGEVWLFTMELVHGRPFDEWVRPGGRLDVQRTRAALAQLLAGVAAIHAAGKLHRDLKPSNVLAADGGGRVVILDFGLLADPLPGGSGQTRDTAVLGTPHYMAPEQARAEPCSAASDLYAVGVMLFEALTGQLPFDGDPVAIMQRKQHEPAPRPARLAAGIPADLDELCSALLQREPAQRPDAAALARSFRVESISSLPPAIGAGARDGGPLFGRDAELKLLRSAYRAAQAGQATLVRVQGESGIGKTTLANAFLDGLRSSATALVLSGRCYERENLPYKAFDRLIDELTRHLRQLPELEVARLLPRHVGALGLIFPVLCRVDAVAARGSPVNIDASELRKRAFDALCELLARLCEQRMLVVHIDDLHWLDHDSTLLLERVFSDPSPPPVLCVLGQRAHTDADSTQLLARVYDAARNNTRMRVHDLLLGPLSAEASLDFANAVLQVDRAAWGRAVAEEGRGNPFFVAELARAAARAAQLGEPPPSPGAFTLEHILVERAASLGPTARTLIEVLAVAGRPTPVAVLVRAAAKADDPHRAVDVLRNARMLRESGKRSYECYHDRIAAAVRASLTEGMVQHYHRQLAEAWASRPDADPEVLFGHWFASGDLERAASHAIAAADAAAASLAFERCAVFLGHAIALLPEAEVVAGDLHARRAQALSLAGRWAEAAQAFGQASDACPQPERGARLQLMAAMHFLGSGHGEQGMPRLASMLRGAGVRWPRNRWLALVSACLRLGWLWLRGAPTPGGAPARPGAEAADARPDASDVVLDHWLVGAGLVPAYDFPRGMHFMSTYCVLGLRSTEGARRGLALGMLSALLVGFEPARARARECSVRALELARRPGNDPALASATLSFVAYARLQDGELQAALQLGQEAERWLDNAERAHAYSAWTSRCAQAHALFTLGRLGEAASLFERNARIALEAGDDLALIGGDSVMRKLVSDDLAGAHALLERKQQVLARLPAQGVLQELAKFERMLCALYEGDGERALLHADSRSWQVTLIDPGTLPACAALQLDPAGKQPRTLRLLRRAVWRLRSRGQHAASQASASQLTAALFLMRGDLPAACAALARAASQYASCEMALHAVLMQLRLTELQHALGRASAQQALAASSAAARFLREQGALRPEAWMQMLAPGLSVRER